MSTLPADPLSIALQLLKQGEFESAKNYLLEAQKLHPHNPKIAINLGITYASIQEYENAINALSLASTLDKLNPIPLYNIALIQSLIGNHLEAIYHYKLCLGLNPNDPATLTNLAASQNDLERYGDAVSSCKEAIRLGQNLEQTWFNLGQAHIGLNHFDLALDAYAEAISINPKNSLYWNQKGLALQELKLHREALDAYENALDLEPHSSNTINNQGIIFLEMQKYQNALEKFNTAIQIEPSNYEAWSNKGLCLKYLNLHDEAIDCFNKAIQLKPNAVSAWLNKAASLKESKQYEDALICLNEAYKYGGNIDFILGNQLHLQMLVCNWDRYQDLCNTISRSLILNEKVMEPFGYQGISFSESELQKCAEIYCEHLYPRKKSFSQDKAPIRDPSSKIKIGYLSGEFRNQATSILLCGVLEKHDKSQFEIIAFDNGWDDQSLIRNRINRAIDKIIPIGQLSDHEAAEIICQHHVDILVNLNGYFGLSRQGAFSLKPSPLQVNYLGFPGTLGADYMDYIIADPIVIPESSQSFYTEKIAYLPNSYQANDDQRIISSRVFTRAEFGLPENAFVFCCFNNNYKITPTTFASWARILNQTPRGVLWLFEDNSAAVKNLKQHATQHNIDPQRIIFAKHMDLADHLARHRLADLFLDTFPYNAHTTASDALWAGLPVLTCQGTTFPGRVGASLLTAIGLQELITKSELEYEALAIELANTPKKLQRIKEKLTANKVLMPLFNTALYTQNLESLYIAMMNRHLASLPPDHLYSKL